MKFQVKSATYAMKGKQLLHQYGIRASVGKSNGAEGCYYYLSVSDKYSETAKRVLSGNEILK